MIHIFRITTAIVIVAVANFLFWPPNESIIERNAGLRLDYFRHYLDTNRPKAVLLGNSIPDDAVDERVVSNLTGIKTIKFIRHGSASAWWYLAIKNVVLKSSARPDIVVIFFRDHFLTDPTFRVDGRYKYLIDEIAEKDEPLLDRLAYLGNMSTVEYTLLRYCPLYQKREKVKSAVDSAIKNQLVASMAGIRPGLADLAIQKVFADDNMNRNLLTIRQLAAESAGDQKPFDFDRQVNRSFLPQIISMCKQNNIRLVLLRMKRRRDAEAEKLPQGLAEYGEKLAKYLADNNVDFIDHTCDPRISLEYFGAGDHLTKDRGRELFTGILAQTIKQIITQPSP
ncbi:MAG: hypothetical protein ABIG61_07880 [Planctomycetota bacterium]